MLLVVGLPLVLISSVSAAPFEKQKSSAANKAPAGQQTAAHPIGETLTITSISGMPNLKVGDHAEILWKTSQASSAGFSPATTLMLTLLRNNNPIGIITQGIYAPTTEKYVWEVGKGTGPAITAFGPGYSIRLCYMDNHTCADSGQFSISAVSSRPPGAYQAVRNFALAAPNGGESWLLGSTQQITWSPGDVSGNVRLYLYQGGMEPNKRVGVITNSTPAAAGKFSWKVGSFLGGVAAAGAGYRVEIKSYSPEKKDASDAAFKIVAEDIPLEAR
jgi:hypothetical protein